MRSCWVGKDYRGDLRAQSERAWVFLCSCCVDDCPGCEHATWVGDEVSDCCPDCGHASLYRNDVE